MEAVSRLLGRRTAHPSRSARILIPKSGPLSDYPDEEIAQYADLFQRGIAEASRVTGRVTVEPQ